MPTQLYQRHSGARITPNPKIRNCPSSNLRPQFADDFDWNWQATIACSLMMTSRPGGLTAQGNSVMMPSNARPTA
jgi:hypothetical protein